MEENKNVRTPRRKKRKSKPGRVIFRVLVMIILIFALAAGVFFVYSLARSYFSGKASEASYGENISIEIPEGSSTKDIAGILKENGLIKSVILFRYESRKRGYDGTYKYGKYLIAEGTPDEEIMEILKKGTLETGSVVITIPEGYTVKQIAERLEENGVCSASEFLSAVNTKTYDYDFLEGIPVREYRLEGYLFPDTYYMDEGMEPDKVVIKMLDRFNEIYSDKLSEEVASSKYDLDEIMTIASIIESEIQLDEEREIASGVIYNRLDEDMPLQMCSTVMYAMGKKKASLLLEDLEIDSPYNTYKNTGLPPGPISNPGRDAIVAAINPQDNDYLYFVLKDNNSGGHVFTETYDEFLTAKEKYKQVF